MYAVFRPEKDAMFVCSSSQFAAASLNFFPVMNAQSWFRARAGSHRNPRDCRPTRDRDAGIYANE
jgi:hypothetical protein